MTKVIIITLFLAGCHDDCDPESTRCDDNVAEICNSERDWEDIIDCQNDIEGGQAICCEDVTNGEDHYDVTCAIVETCEELY